MMHLFLHPNVFTYASSMHLSKRIRDTYAYAFIRGHTQAYALIRCHRVCRKPGMEYRNYGMEYVEKKLWKDESCLVYLDKIYKF